VHNNIINTAYPEKAVDMADLIARLEAAPARVAAAIAGLPAEDLVAHPVAGKWSIAEQVRHIALVSVGWSEIFYSAIEDVYTTPRTSYPGWKAAREAEAEGGVEAAMDVFARQNRSVADFLRALPAGDFARPFKVVAFLTEPFQICESVNWGLVIHADWHLASICRLRALRGTPQDWLSVYLTRYPNADPARATT
jgi:hypothetical protein